MYRALARSRIGTMREAADSVPTFTGTDLETVGSLMHPGVITVPSDTPLRGVGVFSTLDVARALSDGQA